MKILRFVDGKPVEFVLSNAEMYETYAEQRLKWDMGAILDIFAWSGDDDEDKKRYDNISESPELKRRVAKMYREELENDITGEQELQYAREAYEHIAHTLNIQ